MHVNKTVRFDWSAVFESCWDQKLARNRAAFYLMQVSGTGFLSVCRLYDEFVTRLVIQFDCTSHRRFDRLLLQVVLNNNNNNNNINLSVLLQRFNAVLLGYMTVPAASESTDKRWNHRTCLYIYFLLISQFSRYNVRRCSK